MKKKSCNTCDWKLDNGRELPILHKDIEQDVKLAKEYCERTANHNQTMKPIWRKCCGTLDHYKVTIKKSKDPLWKQKLKS